MCIEVFPDRIVLATCSKVTICLLLLAIFFNVIITFATVLVFTLCQLNVWALSTTAVHRECFCCLPYVCLKEWSVWGVYISTIFVDSTLGDWVQYIVLNNTVHCRLSTVQLHKYPHTTSWGCDLLSTVPKRKVLYTMDCNHFVTFLLTSIILYHNYVYVYVVYVMCVHVYVVCRCVWVRGVK